MQMKKTTKEDIKIFEGETLQKAATACLDAGYDIATLKEVWDLREAGKIPSQFYDVATVFLRGEVQNATVKQLMNLEKLYGEDGRVLFLGSNHNDYLNANSNLNYSGRFLGVRRKVK